VESKIPEFFGDFLIPIAGCLAVSNNLHKIILDYLRNTTLFLQVYTYTLENFDKSVRGSGTTQDFFDVIE